MLKYRTSCPFIAEHVFCLVKLSPRPSPPAGVGPVATKPSFAIFLTLSFSRHPFLVGCLALPAAPAPALASALLYPLLPSLFSRAWAGQGSE